MIRCIAYDVPINTEIIAGDRVEVTRTTRGGFHEGPYLATVVSQSTRNRVRVRDEQGKENLPSLSKVRKLS